MYNEFLKLCGFEPQEIEREGPRVERAFKHWGIEAGDISRAEDRIKRFFDWKLTGVRKFLGIWIKEFTDLTLAKEDGKKVVYYPFCPHVDEISSPMAIASEDVYVTEPEVVVCVVMGQLFDKLNPILEKAEETFPIEMGLCAFHQVRFAVINEGMVPMPDLLVAYSLVGEQGAKTDEIIGYLHNVPAVAIDGFNDESGGQWPHPSPRRVRYVAQEMKNLAKTFERVTGHKLTEQIMEQGRESWWQKVMFPVFEIRELKKADPLPLSTKDMNLVDMLAMRPSRRVMAEVPVAAEILTRELKQRVDQGIGVAEKLAPRVVTSTPHLSNPAIIDVFEKSGLVTVGEAHIFVKRRKTASKYESIWDRAAEINLSRCARYSASAFVGEITDMCQEYQPDGVILHPCCNCHSYCTWPVKTKGALKEMGIPVILLEYEDIDTRNYTTEFVRSRVEPFAELVKERKKLTKVGG